MIRGARTSFSRPGKTIGVLYPLIGPLEIVFAGWAPPTSEVLVGGARPTQARTGKRITQERSERHRRSSSPLPRSTRPPKFMQARVVDVAQMQHSSRLHLRP